MEMRTTCPGVKTTCVCPSYIDTGMFEGARLRSTLPALDPLVNAIMPVLSPQYVADSVITAMKRDQSLLVMPRFGYLATLFRALLPPPVFDLAMDLMGVSHSMDHFKQTRA